MTNREKLGEIGEKIVEYVLGGIRSDDKYDEIKDIIIDGKCVEVKTQNRHRGNNTFTINLKHTTNHKKCMMVDRLLFVEYDNSDYIQIWECMDRDDYIVFTTSDGRRMLGWNICSMQCIYKIRHQALTSRMRQLSNSKTINEK